MYIIIIIIILDRISKSQPKPLSVRKLSEDTMIEESSDNNSDNNDDNEIIEMKKYNNNHRKKKQRKNENEKMEIEDSNIESSSSQEEEEEENEKLEEENNNYNNEIVSNNDKVYYKMKSKHYKFKRMKISKSALIHGYGITISEYDALKTDGHISQCVICTDGGELLLCDTCPLSYHKNCVKLDDDDDLDKKWVCPNCVKMFSNPPFMLRNLKNYYTSPLYEACKDIIYLLFTLCDFQILHGESPDNDLYLQLTNEPISYEDVICKFSKQIYTSIGDIYADLQTIWDNCNTYFTTTKSQKNLAKSKCLAHFTKILWFSTLYKINDK